MEQSNDIFQMLDMMERPGFCVKDQIIIKVNAAAAQWGIAPGAAIDTLLYIGRDDYADFAGGCLYLTLMLAGKPRGVSVSRVGEYDIFLPEQESDQIELQALALAARELREPLNSVMSSADLLLPLLDSDEGDAAQAQAARLNRGLFQLLRIICNMSDAGQYSDTAFRPEVRDVCGFLDEIFGKAGELVRHAGITLSFTNLPSPLFCLIDAERLERAIWNILSNSMKFTPRGGSIEATLTRRGNFLCLSVQDSGQGIDDSARSSIFSRYTRQPGIEDGRFGIGLGMVLIRSTAAQHGGTVLIDHPEGQGTRITMTLAIRRSDSTVVRSPIYRVDYTGGWDHSLIELSESLPASLYEVHASD